MKARGHDIVADAADADTIVVHTCSFIEAAKKESINTILEAGRMKGEKKKLIVTGCLVQQHGDEIFKELPEVDAFLGTGQLAQVADLLDKSRARFMDRANPGGFMDPDEPLPRDVELGASRPFSVLSKRCSHPLFVLRDSSSAWSRAKQERRNHFARSTRAGRSGCRGVQHHRTRHRRLGTDESGRSEIRNQKAEIGLRSFCGRSAKSVVFAGSGLCICIRPRLQTSF